MLNENFSITLSEEEYDEYRGDYIGICTSCRELRDSTEPDAENYECPMCGQKDVWGIEILLCMGKIEIE